MGLKPIKLNRVHAGDTVTDKNLADLQDRVELAINDLYRTPIAATQLNEISHESPTNAIFQNSWTSFAPKTSFGTPEYPSFYKDYFGQVHLRGCLAGGTVPSVAFILPPGYRPAKNRFFACWANGAFGGVEVDRVGQVTVLSGSNVQVSLDGITFDVSGG